MSGLSCGHVDGFVCRDCSDGIKWFPRITVERYSVDQTQYALAKLEEGRSRGRLPLLTAVSERLRQEIRTGILHGDWLRELFPAGPEDGYAYDAGNSMVNGGLNSITYLLTTGNPQTTGAVAGHNTLGSGGSSACTSIIGVGCNTTAWAATQTTLSADNTANAWYQQMDATYPTTTANGIINGQVTVATGNGNFSWNEWCWSTGSGTVTAGSQLSAVVTASTMMNRKVPASSLGSKASGASWVFTQTVTFSLYQVWVNTQAFTWYFRRYARSKYPRRYLYLPRLRRRSLAGQRFRQGRQPQARDHGTLLPLHARTG